ncbi:hypothetical protein [Rubrivirga sp. IMCC45206]|uniref:hypothetical protein n=1 Tax=Rubrivirga sp. IMCC45206 TaxID=3391614 RepID=UPI00398FDE7C
MSRLLVLDPACSRPYRSRSLYDRPLDARETDVVRLTDALAQRGHRVTVAQAGRVWPRRSPGGVAYVPFDYGGSWRHLPGADAVVVLEREKVLPRVRRRFPEARLALWLHATPGKGRHALGPRAAGAGAVVVCASGGHHLAVRERIAASDAWARTTYVPSPVAGDLVPDATAPDPDKLVAFAGPGLDEVLAAFAAVRAVRPGVWLYVVGGHGDLGPGAAPLGAIPHREAVRHVRSAFAVLAAQVGAPVPSARALAEAVAVGTPVVAHPHPAVCEALAETPGDGRQLVDARETHAAARRLARWWDEGRPAVRCPSHLRTDRVADEWERLLQATDRVHRMSPAGLRAPAVAA